MVRLSSILHFVTFCILIKWRSTKKACHWDTVSLLIEVLLYCGLILRVWLPGTVNVRLLIHNFFLKVVTQFWCFIKMKASWCWFNSFISVKFSSWCHQFLGGSVNETYFMFLPHPSKPVMCRCFIDWDPPNRQPLVWKFKKQEFFLVPVLLLIVWWCTCSLCLGALSIKVVWCLFTSFSAGMLQSKIRGWSRSMRSA